MGKVKTTWLLPGHSGRPCHHENIYTKMNKKTGQVYSVKLCNPNDATTTSQSSQRTNFGSIASALSSWISTNKVSTATDHSVYQQVKTAFDRQTKYSTLRGYMMAKNMAAVQTDGSVKITIGTYTSTVSAGTVSNGTTTGGGTSAATYNVTLTASPTNGGTVSGSCTNKAAGSQITISAVANSGYTFTQWSDGNTNSSRTMTINSNINLTATFTATSSGGGENTSGGTNDDEESGF